jgi:transposase
MHLSRLDKRMSFCRQPVPIPDETRNIAERVCVGSTGWYLSLSRELRRIYSSLDIESLYPDAGQWGIHPYRAFAFLMLQILEGLSDRGAAGQVTLNIGWKFVLALPLDHPGWDPTVLCTERDRLLKADVLSILDKQIAIFKEKGLVDTIKQRLDSTPIEACVKSLNRTELIYEAVRNAIEGLAQEAPEWLSSISRPDWKKRYYLDRPFNYRLPKKETERQKLAQTSGEDGFYILKCIKSQVDEEKRTALDNVDGIRILKQVLEDQFHPPDDSGKPRLRDAKELKPSGDRLVSPHETDARRACKGGDTWDGYKLHTTETCVKGAPNFITDARIEPSTKNDSLTLPDIVERLKLQERLPKKLFVDSGYVNAPFFTKAQAELGLEIISPLLNGHSWQSAAQKGFDSSNFEVNFSTRQASCPAGILSSNWKPKAEGHVDIYFPKHACSACSFKTDCTKAERRILKVQPEPVYQHQRIMRLRQETPEFKQEYSTRAGAEATQSEIVRIAGRQSTLKGQAKTNLKYVLACIGINFGRYFRWENDRRPRVTPSGKFLTLAIA